MFKLFIKHKIVDFCINNFFDKVIQNFNYKDPAKKFLTAKELTAEHSGSRIAQILFTFRNELVVLDESSETIDKIYLFNAWFNTGSSDSCWQIHVRHNDGNQFHYPIGDDALLYLVE